MASKDGDTSKRRRKPATSETPDTSGAEQAARTPARGPRQQTKRTRPAEQATPPPAERRRRPPAPARTGKAEQPAQTIPAMDETQAIPAASERTAASEVAGTAETDERVEVVETALDSDLASVAADEPLAALGAEEAALAEETARGVTDEGILADADAIGELPPTARVIVVEPSEDEGALEEAGEEGGAVLLLDPAASTPGGRRYRAAHGNALGILIERHFLDAASPCRSYSDLERRSGISREALSRYVTARPDRRRSPTIDTLVAIADAMHISVEAVCRAAAASVKNVVPPPDEIERGREEVLGTLTAALSDDQYSAVVELLRQMRPVSDGLSRRE
jgi:transcriptional regulator with XRE-family HTH domain